MTQAATNRIDRLIREMSLAEKLGQLRVIDESGEDYLYPKESFVRAELSQPVRRAVFQAA